MAIITDTRTLMNTLMAVKDMGTHTHLLLPSLLSIHTRIVPHLQTRLIAENTRTHSHYFSGLVAPFHIRKLITLTLVRIPTHTHIRIPWMIILTPIPRVNILIRMAPKIIPTQIAIPKQTIHMPILMSILPRLYQKSK